MSRKVSYTKAQMVGEILCLAVLLFTALGLWLRWPGIPGRIPTHYGFSGEADAWGSKDSLWILWLVQAGLYLLLTVVTFFPKVWNTPVPVTEANRNFVYSTTLSMLIVMKLVIVCVFFYLVVIAGGQEKSLGGWFFPVVLIGIFGPLVYFCRKCSRGARAIENMAQNGKSAS